MIGKGRITVFAILLFVGSASSALAEHSSIATWVSSKSCWLATIRSMLGPPKNSSELVTEMVHLSDDELWRGVEKTHMIPGPFPSQKYFEKRFPYPQESSALPLTRVNINSTKYGVERYDSANGTSTLSRRVFSKIKWDPDLNLKVGAKVQHEGHTWTVFSDGLASWDKLSVQLARVEKIEIPWERLAREKPESFLPKKFKSPLSPLEELKEIRFGMNGKYPRRKVELIDLHDIRLKSQPTNPPSNPWRDYEFKVRNKMISVFVEDINGSKAKAGWDETKIKGLLAKIPVGHEDVLESITIHTDDKIKGNSTAAGVAHSWGGIDLLGTPKMESVTDTFWHELGHHIALKHWRNWVHEDEWLNMLTRDQRKFAISRYATSALDEDFAESVFAYIKTDGGRWDPALQRRMFHRFRFLDQFFLKD